MNEKLTFIGLYFIISSDNTIFCFILNVPQSHPIYFILTDRSKNKTNGS